MTYITIDSPISGMSMNPASTLCSAGSMQLSELKMGHGLGFFQCRNAFKREDSMPEGILRVGLEPMACIVTRI
jgi:hypothetical protein